MNNFRFGGRHDILVVMDAMTFNSKTEKGGLGLGYVSGLDKY